MHRDRSIEKRASAQFLYISLSVALLLFLTLGVYAYGPARFAYERTVLHLFPSADRAFWYGENHFSSKRARMYDIRAAEYFYYRAEALDSKYPTLQHELARVAFLRGNYELALARMDKEFEFNPQPAPSSYYVKGLIEGYMGRYDDAARDYEEFLKFGEDNWAAINDYAWVLLKAEHPADAHRAIAHGLELYPDNAWLLNSDAIALYETGDIDGAFAAARAAIAAADRITEREWLIAYPGNDPKTARAGIATLRKSAFDNMHTIEAAAAADAIQSDD